MKFGAVATAEAKGSILAHALTLKGSRLKKGHLLTAHDLRAAKEEGIDELVVALLEQGDVAEDEAAKQLGQVLTADDMRATKPFTGRVNIYAKCPGIFSARSDLVTGLNRIDPGITFATLADQTFVQTGRMIATVKIIPFAVKKTSLEKALSICAKGSLIALTASRPHRAGLIATQLPSLKTSVMDKTAGILRKRFQVAGSVLVEEKRVAHTAEAVGGALSQLVTVCDMIIVFGASAITDRADVIPTGIEAAEGSVETLGMPVDPGNLLLTGKVGGVPVIGAPGCARSPAENGFDWVLQRMLAGLDVGPDYITSLGVGGLLMEIHDRPQPREG